MNPATPPSQQAGALPGGHFPFLVTTPARPQDWRRAGALLAVSVLVFLTLAPFATIPLTPIPALVGIYQTALVGTQLLAGTLLLAKYVVLPMRALLYLACAFVFSAFMAIAHGLTFPGLFRPSGLLAATPQTTAWLYMFWHAGFPLLVMVYARTKRIDSQPTHQPTAAAIGLALCCVLIAVAALAALASFGSWMLPTIMTGNVQNFPVMKPVVASVCALNALAALVLWRSRPHSVFDVWMILESTHWTIDIALAAGLNAARFDLGFYAGRVYGLFTAQVIVVVLLYESTRLYGRLVVAYQRDIALRIELQNLYRKAQDLDQIKTRFFANMSHEIRTPMNAIIGITYLLQQAQPRPEQRDHLNKIELAGRHLLSSINDLLDYSKIESGMMTLEDAPFALASVLDHTRTLIEDGARAKGLAIQVDGDGCPAWLVGDLTRLRQAMLNLASNAVKFTEQGLIVLRCAPTAREGDHITLRFEVQDTGIGIAASKLDGLFQPFRQIDPSTTRKYGGTGLGLAITQRLAELMGGTVGVDSTPGQGSRFWFTARLRVGQEVQGVPPDHAEQTLREHHADTPILVVEDEPVNQTIVRELLQQAGLRVDCANDGPMALDLVGKHHFDLILMDIQMPGMDGLEVTRRIRKIAQARDIPILALTANTYAQDRQECMEAGMNDVLGKPIEPDELFATLLKWLPPSAGAVPTASRQLPAAPREEAKSRPCPP